MSFELVQTVALCLMAFALVIIAFSAFMLMVRLTTMLTPFDLIADIQSDKETIKFEDYEEYVDYEQAVKERDEKPARSRKSRNRRK
jgi:hypothetical protein